LLDVLPRGVNKASGLRWWAQFQQRELDQIVYAGDSGNDLAALTDHFRAILVGNADRQLARQIHEHHAQQGSLSRLYLARGHATQGVLEGCLFFGLIKSEAEAIHPA
jgi:phosphoserine phosphatase